MSWPVVWPQTQQAAAQNVQMPPIPNYVAGGLQAAPMAMMPGHMQFAQMTPEQQFAMQQNWQQWQTYQQQYAQWQAQYGEQVSRVAFCPQVFDQTSISVILVSTRDPSENGCTSYVNAWIAASGTTIASNGRSTATTPSSRARSKKTSHSTSATVLHSCTGSSSSSTTAISYEYYTVQSTSSVTDFEPIESSTTEQPGTSECAWRSQWPHWWSASGTEFPAERPTE